jgi:hypothetical protein
LHNEESGILDLEFVQQFQILNSYLRDSL